ncbi:MAG: response regulator [Chthoniobacterales bacterium]
MPPSSSISTDAKPCVLLIEEYAALAAAIGAALKKYAPRHRIERARSLSAALDAARAAPPDLLLLDFDPPLTHVLDFFNELRVLCPTTRVIIIGADLPLAALRDERLPTVFTYICKPFELHEFGARITALIGSVQNSAAATSARPLAELGVADIIPLLGMENVTGTVNVSAADGALAGEIAFARGRIPNASANGLLGIDALREMVRWPSPEFFFADGPSVAPPSIEGRWPHVLGQILRAMPLLLPKRSAPKKTDTGARQHEPRADLPPPPVKDGKKVLVIDDTETLRIFVEEMLATADPGLQIECAADAAEGLDRSVRMHPDLILLDYSLPDRNGDEICRSLLADETLRDIPVIMMSGHTAEMTDAAACYENIVRTLPKPFVSGELIDAVTAILAQPPARRSGATLLPPTRRNADSIAPPAPTTATVIAAVPETSPPPSLSSAETPSLLTPARISSASKDVVVLSIGLEVVSILFSAALRVSSIRARPTSDGVLLQFDPQAAPTSFFPEIAFEMCHAEVDEHGQLQRLRLIPAAQRPPALLPHAGVPIERFAMLQPNGTSGGLQITPRPAAHMSIQLLAAFDLAGVELSPSFSVNYFALTARSGRMRVFLPGPSREGGGSIFETRKVSVDSAGRIAEVLLGAVRL